MKLSEIKIAEWFLRISLSAGFLSASADRFGMWPKEVSAWGNWKKFLTYTQKINPLIPAKIIPVLAYGATVLEIILGVLLLTTFKTKWIANGCGFLLLIFALAMTFSNGIKAPLDYSVFSASAAAFSLSLIVQAKLDK